VDVEGHAVEVYRAPTASGYSDAQRTALDGFVSPAAFPDLRVSVAELLG
jgi:Uma2 family endonuclease